MKKNRIMVVLAAVTLAQAGLSFAASTACSIYQWPQDKLPVSMHHPIIPPDNDSWRYVGGGPWFYEDAFDFIDNAANDALSAYDPPFGWWDELPLTASTYIGGIYLKTNPRGTPYRIFRPTLDPAPEGYGRVLEYANIYFDYKCPTGSFLTSISSPTGFQRACMGSAVCVTNDPKNLGQPRFCPVGNPVNPATGNKFLVETDVPEMPLSGIGFVRYYNSHQPAGTVLPQDLGPNWRSSPDRSITVSGDSATALRPDGKRYNFRKLGGGWTADADVTDRLTQTASGWEYTTRDDSTESYDANGYLVSITDIKGTVQALVRNAQGKIERISSSVGHFLQFTYTPAGRLDKVTDQAGRVWTYTYDAWGRLEYVYSPDGTPGDITDNPYRRYHYNESAHTAGVSILFALTGISDGAGGVEKRYATYEYDGQGRAVATYRGPESANPADRIENVTIQYDPAGYPAGSRIVTNSLGEQSVYSTSTQLGLALVTDISGPGCSSCGAGNTGYSYDPATNTLLSRTENGVTTEWAGYDNNLNPTLLTEAKATGEERTSYFSYDSRFQSRKTATSRPSVSAGDITTTAYSYDDFGNILTARVSRGTADGQGGATNVVLLRQTDYQYNGPLHQLSRIDGPRTDIIDITTFEYYADDAVEGYNRARLKRVTEPTGIIGRDNLTYTATGKVETEGLPNGLARSYTYYAGNDRLETLTEQGTDGVSRVTRWTYLATGEVASITTAFGAPEASTISLGYDDARRLVRVTDGLGNHIDFTLDTEGNQLEESVFDTAGTLRRQLTRTFDLYNRLDTTSQANETVDSDFAADGTLTRQTDGHGSVTGFAYDALKRLTSQTANLGLINARTLYGYDVGDRLTSVTDPNGNTTTYVYDDLGNKLSESSPDTGVTTYTYDEAGNVLTRTDALGQVINYTYDAADRLTFADAPGTADDITYGYDACANGVGRLCSMTDATGTTAYAYDWRGNQVSEVRTMGNQVHTILYSYDLNDNLTGIGYPSGRQVSYVRDGGGRITNVSTAYDGTTQTLASNITYAPFGPVTSLTYGNGITETRSYDTAYRLNAHMAGATLNRGHVYDTAGNLTAITTGSGTASVSLDPTAEEAGTADVGELDVTGAAPDAQAVDAATFSYVYDALNRLTRDTGPYGQRDYQYDVNGNRTQRVKLDQSFDAQGNPITVTRTQDYSYAPGTNHLGNITTTIDGVTTDHLLNVDPLGNTLEKNNGKKQFTYNVANRLTTFAKDGVLKAEYFYNGNGQRTIKVKHKTDGTTKTIHYHYNQDGQLLGFTRYNAAGDLKAHKEFVWLDTMPIAQITTRYKSDGTVKAVTTLHIHSDHLNTPRVATDENQITVWRWDSDAFGQGRPDTDPDQNGTKTFIPLRFPGQIASEGGLYYNYFRTYHPATGRYITADPIGLAGGINPYVYSGNNSIRFADPTGEFIPALAGCFLNPVCAAGVRAGVTGIIGGLSAFAAALNDPCFDGNLKTVVAAGVAAGIAAGVTPGAGALRFAALRGGLVGVVGNAAGQIVVNEGVSNFSLEQASIAGAVGAASLAAGNFAGFNSALNAARLPKINSTLALAIGTSKGAAASTLTSAAVTLTQLNAQSSSGQGCECRSN